MPRCQTCGRLIERNADCEHCVRVASDAASDAARERAWLDWVTSDYTAPAPPPPSENENWEEEE